MGICLDTDQQNGSQVFEESNARQNTGRWRGEAGLLQTPPQGHFPKQNAGPVKFEMPKIPVIFVLGGPGSGKVTHCDTLMQEIKGITHINMTDLLQQYTLGNDMQDFGQLSSKTVTEVLMLEMKMSPEAKVFLVSGYPRNMRDVVEYGEKIKIANGAVLVSWRQEVLERQIALGAQLGHVKIELAKMELHNFYRNVMPVAEYFDQNGDLLEVSGERAPNEVYADFRDAVMRILGMFARDDKAERAGAQSVEAEVQIERNSSGQEVSTIPLTIAENTAPTVVATNLKPSKTADKPRKGIPAFIWVIGGPGSNKANLCTMAVRDMPGWVHVSIGGLLRSMASSNTVVNEAIVSGEMVPSDIVMQVIEQQIILNRDTDGIVIDGYPRDLHQVQSFESKFGQEPPLVLLDCSKLQLGRGRLDDSVSAFRKRLEIFREVSLPMLKTLDTDGRLTIVDGDTDVPSVQQDFATTLYQLMRQARRKEERTPRNSEAHAKSEVTAATLNSNKSHNIAANGTHRDNGVANGIAGHVLATNAENGMTAINNAKNLKATIKTGVSNVANGLSQDYNGLTNGAAHMLQNGAAHLVSNGVIPNTNKVGPVVKSYLSTNNTVDPVRNMYNEVGDYTQSLHM